MHHKWRSNDVTFLRYKVRRTEFFVILDHFFPLWSSLQLKKSWRYYHFTLAYRKWQLYVVWFLRSGVRQTEYFLNLDHFLHIYTRLQPRKSKFWKNEKISWRYHQSIQVYHKWQWYDVMIPEIWNATDRIFLSFWATFCPFSPVTIQKIKILKKWKKSLEQSF